MKLRSNPDTLNRQSQAGASPPYSEYSTSFNAASNKIIMAALWHSWLIVSIALAKSSLHMPLLILVSLAGPHAVCFLNSRPYLKIWQSLHNFFNDTVRQFLDSLWNIFSQYAEEQNVRKLCPSLKQCPSTAWSRSHGYNSEKTSVQVGVGWGLQR